MIRPEFNLGWATGGPLAHHQPKQWAICYFWWADTYFDSVHLYFNNFKVLVCFYERSMRNSWTYCYMLNVISQKCDHDLASYFMKICLYSCWCQCQCSTALKSNWFLGWPSADTNISSFILLEVKRLPFDELLYMLHIKPTCVNTCDNDNCSQCQHLGLLIFVIFVYQSACSET